MTKRLSKHPVDLLKYPNITTNIQEEITLGDLHGNALKFLHLLIQEGVFFMSPDAYKEFIYLYQLPADEIDENEFENISTLIRELKTPHPEIFVRLIGDEHFDRGNNDYYIDLILEKMNTSFISYEIILSNHGVQSIQQIELIDSDAPFYDDTDEDQLQFCQLTEEELGCSITCIIANITKKLETIQDDDYSKSLYFLHCQRIAFYMNAFNSEDVLQQNACDLARASYQMALTAYDSFYKSAISVNPGLADFEKILSEHFSKYIELQKLKEKQEYLEIVISQKQSFKNLCTFLDRGLITISTIQLMYERYYAPYLKLLSYSADLETKTLTIYSHAPCGINSIEQLCQFFGLKFESSTWVCLAQTIDNLNSNFKNEFVDTKNIRSLVSDDASEQESIVYNFIWNRDYTMISRPATITDYNLQFVHGHDRAESNPKAHIYCLDSPLGGQSYSTDGPQPIFKGTDLVLKGRNETSLLHLRNRYHQECLSQIQKLSKHQLKRKFDEDNEASSPYQAIFEKVHEQFQTYIKQDYSFPQFVKILCDLIADTSPRISYEAVEKLINILHKIHEITPAKPKSCMSIFAASISTTPVDELLDELKEFLSHPPNLSDQQRIL